MKAPTISVETKQKCFFCSNGQHKNIVNDLSFLSSVNRYDKAWPHKKLGNTGKINKVAKIIRNGHTS